MFCSVEAIPQTNLRFLTCQFFGILVTSLKISLNWPFQYSESTYPPFVTGPSYLVSRSAVDRILPEALEHPFIHLVNIFDFKMWLSTLFYLFITT